MLRLHAPLVHTCAGKRQPLTAEDGKIRQEAGSEPPDRGIGAAACQHIAAKLSSGGAPGAWQPQPRACCCAAAAQVRFAWACPDLAPLPFGLPPRSVASQLVRCSPNVISIVDDLWRLITGERPPFGGKQWHQQLVQGSGSASPPPGYLASTRRLRPAGVRLPTQQEALWEWRSAPLRVMCGSWNTNGRRMPRSHLAAWLQRAREHLPW